MHKPNIASYSKKIAQFCKKYHISKMALFGSILTDEFTAKSDVDFLVDFEKKHTPTFFALANMEEELSHIIGYKADLRTPQDLSRYFRDEVMAQAKIIYGNS